jgi:hypothetical protein
MAQLTWPAAVKGLSAVPMNENAVSPFPALPSASNQIEHDQVADRRVEIADGIRVGVERGARLGDRMPDEDVPK